jgi:cytochrome c oxidase subunit 3
MATAVEPRVLEPQFDDLDQQRNASVLGMWVFLATEILLFGGIITAFLALRVFYPHDFEHAAGKLNLLIGGLNTLVLLTSSLSMALAVHYSEKGQQRNLAICLAITAFIGVSFLFLKGCEYYSDWLDGLIPLTSRFEKGDWADINRGRAAIFMMFYFILTGIHAVHLTIAICLVGWLFVRSFERDVSTEADVIGLYWHFVDVVWIFLLPLLYLSGHHQFSNLHFF